MPPLLKPSLRVAVCEYHDRSAKKTRWTWQLEEAVLSQQGFPVSPRYSCRWMWAPCVASTCLIHVWPFIVSQRMNILQQATWNWKQHCILLLRGGKECSAVENSETIMSDNWRYGAALRVVWRLSRQLHSEAGAKVMLRPKYFSHYVGHELWLPGLCLTEHLTLTFTSLLYFVAQYFWWFHTSPVHKSQ